MNQNPLPGAIATLFPPVAERERIEQAIAEVLATELPTDFELILVNDGSTDGTTEILRAGDWGENVRLLEHERNQGKGAAIQTGLRDARGEFAAIFDAAKSAGKPIGILAPAEADARRYLALGATFVAVGSDLGVFRSATQQLRDRYARTG